MVIGQVHQWRLFGFPLITTLLGFIIKCVSEPQATAGQEPAVHHVTPALAQATWAGVLAATSIVLSSLYMNHHRRWIAQLAAYLQLLEAQSSGLWWESTLWHHRGDSKSKRSPRSAIDELRLDRLDEAFLLVCSVASGVLAVTMIVVAGASFATVTALSVSIAAFLVTFVSYRQGDAYFLPAQSDVWREEWGRHETAAATRRKDLQSK